jgi:histidinol dehydrogenase
MGINLFPHRKICSFDCPYCEVFPFESGSAFSVEAMKAGLAEALDQAHAKGIPVRDICFSGNGEPTMSPDFPQALDAAARLRDEAAGDSALVLITNGGGLLNGGIFDLLRRSAAGPRGLHIWLKLDAGTPGWYASMNRSSVSFDTLIGRIREFVSLAPVTIQTMLCKIDGKAPPPGEAQAWTELAAELVCAASGGIRGVQIYGKARPAPEDPLAESLPQAFLEDRAAALRKALDAAGGSGPAFVPVEVFP